MKKEDFEGATRSEYDGKIVKSKLSKDIAEKYKTESQWLEKKRRVKAGAVPVEMHPTMMNKKICEHYTMEQTEEEDRETCATCVFRSNRWCPVAGVHISMKYRCSEWSD